jgi:hypothetical protein
VRFHGHSVLGIGFRLAGGGAVGGSSGGRSGGQLRRGGRGSFAPFFRTSLGPLRAPRYPGKPHRLAATFCGHGPLGAGLRFAAVGGSLRGWRVAL